MSWTVSQTVTTVALVVLLLAAGLTWQLADVRAAQATDHKQTELVEGQVPERQAPADYDGDGIDDGTDRCPTRPESTNGFQDGDGCPDIVASTGAS